MPTALRPLTYVDLEAEREGTTNTVELIEGELIVSPAPTFKHQRLLGRLYAHFERALPEQVDFAPLDVRLGEHNIVQPDLVVILDDREGIITDVKIEGAPSLVVEVASRATRQRDRAMKRDLYALHHVPEFWLVEPEFSTATIYSDPHGGRYQSELVARDIARSVTIPELSIDLAILFAPVRGLKK